MKQKFSRFHPIRSQFAISLLLIMSLTLNVQAQNSDATPRTVTVKQGQILEMAIVKRLNSGHAKVGDPVVLKLTKPLMADGATVLPTNWVISGRVTDVKRAAKNCQPGLIRWELEPLAMSDGKKIEIHSVANDVAAQRLRDQATHDKTTLNTVEKDSRASTLIDVALLPVGIAFLAVLMFSEIKYGEPGCRGGKGSEESIPRGRAFYAEISDDVQQVVN